MKKVLFISSAGGHLSELMQMEYLINKYESYIVTEKTESTINLKNIYGNRISFLIHTSRKPFIKFLFKFIFNIIKSIIIYFKYRPDVIVTTGANCVIPICYIGKIMRSKIVYIESFARVESLSLTGKNLKSISDLFFVQHRELKEKFQDTIYEGRLF